MTTLTTEFKDFYNMDFNKSNKVQGQLPLDVLKEMKENITKTLIDFDTDVNKVREYLDRASASSETDVQCFIYMMLHSEVWATFPMSGKDIKNVLLKYEPFLRDLKEFNKPSK